MRFLSKSLSAKSLERKRSVAEAPWLLGEGGAPPFSCLVTLCVFLPHGNRLRGFIFRFYNQYVRQDVIFHQADLMVSPQ